MIDALLGVLIGAAVLGIAAWAADRHALPVYCTTLQADAVRRLPPWDPRPTGPTC